TRALSSLALAHIGDAVYELFARTHIAETGRLTASGAHRAAIALVSAHAQAAAARVIVPLLDDAERSVFARGRNARVHTVPKHADLAEYHAATALEALFGYLYLTGGTARAGELFAAGLNAKEAT
ncbi:MAG: ribonuclease III, partial [Oscillospiraceae bacterium]|nr:ribonuclease III [Oscillospiraceae bacterium]